MLILRIITYCHYCRISFLPPPLLYIVPLLFPPFVPAPFLALSPPSCYLLFLPHSYSSPSASTSTPAFFLHPYSPLGSPLSSLFPVPPLPHHIYMLLLLFCLPSCLLLLPLCSPVPTHPPVALFAHSLLLFLFSPSSFLPLHPSCPTFAIFCFLSLAGASPVYPCPRLP